MKPEDLAAANERIADPPEFRISGTARLGLYVVSQLAERHDVKVVLKHSPYGGTTVVVLLPQELVEVDAGPDPADTDATPRLPRRSPAAATATAARPVERPATERNVRALKVAGPSRPPRQPQPDLPQRIEKKGAATEPQPEAPSVFTPGGLPLRVPQANLAAALRDEGPPTTPDRSRARMAALHDSITELPTRLPGSPAVRLSTQGFLATPQTALTTVGGSSQRSRGGCHSGVGTTPGATRSRPARKAPTCSGLRNW